MSIANTGFPHAQFRLKPRNISPWNRVQFVYDENGHNTGFRVRTKYHFVKRALAELAVTLTTKNSAALAMVDLLGNLKTTVFPDMMLLNRMGDVVVKLHSSMSDNGTWRAKITYGRRENVHFLLKRTLTGTPVLYDAEDKLVCKSFPNAIHGDFDQPDMCGYAVSREGTLGNRATMHVGPVKLAPFNIYYSGDVTVRRTSPAAVVPPEVMALLVYFTHTFGTLGLSSLLLKLGGVMKVKNPWTMGKGGVVAKHMDWRQFKADLWSLSWAYDLATQLKAEEPVLGRNVTMFTETTGASEVKFVFHTSSEPFKPTCAKFGSCVQFDNLDCGNPHTMGQLVVRTDCKSNKPFGARKVFVRGFVNLSDFQHQLHDGVVSLDDCATLFKFLLSQMPPGPGASLVVHNLDLDILHFKYK